MTSNLWKYAGTLLVGVVLGAVIVLVVVHFEKSKGSTISNANGTRVTDSLKFIAVISRHGNRGAKQDYFNDPYPLSDPKLWPYGSFELSPQGRVEMYKLGQKIRSMYNGFLNSTTFNTAELHASSTYNDRMMISGEAFLAGLYPPQGFQVWNKDIPWQPTPLYSDSPDHLLTITSCARDQAIRTGLTLPFYEKYAANFTEVIDYYNSATSANMSTDMSAFPDLWRLWDKIITEKAEGYKSPDWVAGIYESLKNLVAGQYIEFYAGTDELIRLLIGNMFEEILEAMKSVVNGTMTDRKIQYYSGHDTTIVAMQPLLGIPLSNVLGMIMAGSGMILELHQNPYTNIYSIEVLFIDGSTSDLEPVTMTIPSNDFSTIVNNTRKYMGVNYEQECQLTNSSSLSEM